MVSSASTTATAATLAAAGKLTPETAGVAAILTSMSSALVNLPLVYQQTHQRQLMRKMTAATVMIVGIGIVVLLAASPKS